MPMKFKSDNELLEFVSNEGVSRTHCQGYFWFWRKFIPTLERAAVSSSVSSDVITGCYYVAGDVHDFNDAPSTAIKCYKKALDADSNCGAAHREIANMLGRLGRYDQALSHSDMAFAIDPNDRHALSDRKDFIGENRLMPPLNPVGDPICTANECLAKAKPQLALKALRKAKGIRSQRAKACCYGAMERTKDYLGTWCAYREPIRTYVLA